MTGGEGGVSALIVPLRPADGPELWAIFEPVIRAGETYAHPRDWTAEDVARAWFAPSARVYGARDPTAGALLGAFSLKPNALGGGDHVANASFVTAEAARGGGVGRAMGVFALEEAKRLGFAAMQFNFVIATNTHALALWRSLGFQVVGTVPSGFRHPRHGVVDVHILHRDL